MKYSSHLKQLSVDMFRSSFDEPDKNNRRVKLGNLLPWPELEKAYNSRLESLFDPSLFTTIRKHITIEEIYKYYQQLEMFDEKKHQCRGRIVSIFRPHVHPIVRGKSKAPTKFGAKIGAAVYERYTFIDRHSRDAYNESTDLLLQIQLFKERFGYLPLLFLQTRST